MKKAVGLGLVAFSFLCVVPDAGADGFVVQNGRVDQVSNTRGNVDNFVVHVSGGIGLCADSWLTFKRVNMGNDEVLRRAFALALTALATGYRVDVWSYKANANVNCETSAYIVVKP